VADRKKLRQYLGWLQRVKTWQLAIVLVVLIPLAATALHNNNVGMVQLRDAVKKADESGDKEALRRSIATLQTYVAAHMNASLDSGFYLEHQYERDRDAALATLDSSTNPNSTVYQQASVECRSRFHGGVASYRNDYVACVAERVKALGTASDPVTDMKLPRASNYHYNFVSPLWSPDFAGLMVALCLFVTSVIIWRAATLLFLRLLLRRRFKNA